MRGIGLWRSVGNRIGGIRSGRGDDACGLRGISAGSDLQAKAVASAEGSSKPLRVRKKLVKQPKFGLDDSTTAELERVRDAREDIDKWIEHPTFFSMISEDALTQTKSDRPRKDPPGKGPILRWQTCVVFPSDGTSWHPLNRKVKVSVYVRELRLTPMQKKRLVDMVEKRYNPEEDELTITCDKYDQREENRKEVLRILYALLEEATNPIASLKDKDNAMDVSTAA